MYGAHDDTFSLYKQLDTNDHFLLCPQHQLWQKTFLMNLHKHLTNQKTSNRLWTGVGRMPEQTL